MPHVVAIVLVIAALPAAISGSPKRMKVSQFKPTTGP
jgi:hypothetical protein